MTAEYKLSWGELERAGRADNAVEDPGSELFRKEVGGVAARGVEFCVYVYLEPHSPLAVKNTGCAWRKRMGRRSGERRVRSRR